VSKPAPVPRTAIEDLLRVLVAGQRSAASTLLEKIARRSGAAVVDVTQSHAPTAFTDQVGGNATAAPAAADQGETNRILNPRDPGLLTRRSVLWQGG